MKPFLENTNIEELELIQLYMETHKIQDPSLLTEKDYEIIEESRKDSPRTNGTESKISNAIFHMIKYKVQPSNQKADWLDSIRNGCSLIPTLTTNQYKECAEDIDKMFNNARYDKRMESETGLKVSDSSLPNSLIELFGSNNLSDLGSWDYINTNLIVPYANHSKAAEMVQSWRLHWWDSSKLSYKTGNKYKK